ncbi:derlin-2 like protein [Capsaspora owczarzaki ATCC 30864]|uniref:Derlin n=1 Tax=Capsaspora owczarzaki (strain ATCC 30864) TaxID=595528 RepID=A0A0D2X056_CAPO3|nr:derlin-2 like protein [Capsaspora owczarzaki ATCC 30864]KJE88474.1 derlin-2 like protein [Capsaspora owczarzaki ATCC 30864]|eukprot:XP_004364999.2 derlin-2 like protein [Capsaspora owczarzaki ATCC 30864]
MTCTTVLFLFLDFARFQFLRTSQTRHCHQNLPMSTIERWFFGVPIVTRCYITACVLSALAVQLRVVNLLQLLFRFDLIFYQHEYWRLITHLCFFGGLQVGFFFHMFFVYHYSRSLEEELFHRRSGDFFYMITIGVVLLNIIASFLQLYTSFESYFLGSALTFMLVYVWSKHKGSTRMFFLGLFSFRAPFLPWILLGFSLITSPESTAADIIGIAIGHIYYFLHDVVPLEFGAHPLKTPRFFTWLFETRPVVPTVPEGAAAQVPQPGGFEWGAAEPVGNVQIRRVAEDEDNAAAM